MKNCTNGILENVCTWVTNSTSVVISTGELCYVVLPLLCKILVILTQLKMLIDIGFQESGP